MGQKKRVQSKYLIGHKTAGAEKRREDNMYAVDAVLSTRKRLWILMNVVRVDPSPPKAPKVA